MKRQHLVTLVLSLILAIVVLPGAALAADVFNYKDQSATADFSYSDGCTDTYVGVYASENAFRNPPAPKQAQSAVSVYLYQYNYCTGELVREAYGFVTLDEAAFQMSNLDSATLNATVELYDYVSQAPYTVSINLSWTGTGEIRRGNSHSHQHFAGCNINSRWNGASRQAQASGSVSDGTTNFTPGPSVYGSLQQAKSGQVRTTCSYP